MTAPLLPRTAPVVVTGCSSGIGRATVLALLRHGRPVWATARQVDSVADLGAAGARVLALDVTDEDSMVEAVHRVVAEHGSVGGLVNNAGYALYGPVEELSTEAVRRQFETRRAPAQPAGAARDACRRPRPGRQRLVDGRRMTRQVAGPTRPGADAVRRGGDRGT